MAYAVVLDSVNEDIFVCSNCNSVYNSLPCYLEHKQLSCNEELIDQFPTLDNLQTETEPSYVSDIATALPQEQKQDQEEVTLNEKICISELSCKTCKNKFDDIESLLTHGKFHKYESYQCPICGRCFTQNSHLQRHTLAHRVWAASFTERTPMPSEENSLSYSCPYCKQIMPNYKKVRIHMKSHSSLKQYKCIQEACSNFYDNINALLGHVSEMHPTPEYTCHICDEKYNSLHDIAEHQKKHNELVAETRIRPKKYKCPLCEAIFKHPEKLSLHMATDSHNNTCIHCNKTFVSANRLRLHLKIHSESKPYVCNICGIGFHVKKYLRTHMVRHGSKSFECVVCKSKFGRQDLLQRHMRIHEEYKMYPCYYKDTLDCKKEFSRLDKLKAHLKSHTKNKTKPKLEESNTISSAEFNLPKDSIKSVES